MALMTRNFLSFDELGGNRDIAAETLGYAAKGLSNQLGREQVTAARATNAKNAADLEEQNRLRAEREAIGTAWMTPVQAMAQPASQPPELAEPAVTPSYEQAVAEPVPAPAQIVPQNIPPQGQILTPQKIEQYAAQPNAQTTATVQAPRVEPVVQVPQMPMPQRYQAQSAEAPAPVAAQPMPALQPTSAPVEMPAIVPPQVTAPIEDRQSFLRGTPEINGIANPLSDQTTAQRLQAVHQLYKDGKIRGSTATQFIDTIVSQRDKQIDRALDLQSKFQEIQNSDFTADEKRMKIAAAVRGADDNKYFEVYQTLRTQGPEQAKVTAQVLGLPADIIASDNIKMIETRARRSSDFREAQKAAAEAKKADIEERKAAVLETRAETDAKRAETRDAEAQRRLEQNDRRLDLAERRAQAVEARVTARGSNRVATGQNDDGSVSGIKIDKQGNRTLDPIVAKNLVASNRAAQNGQQIIRQIDDLEKTKVIERSPESIFGRAGAVTQEALGVSGSLRNARDQFEQFKNGALAAVDSPLMKGAPSEADARRALSALGDERASVETKKRAVRELRAAIEEAIQSHREAVNMYDDETRKRLRGLGVKSESAPKANSSGWTVEVK